jgi:minor extracellular protease Epr
MLLRRLLALIACALVAAPAAAQQSPAQRLPRLRDSVANVQGRVIITLKSDRPGAAVRLPGDPPVSLSEQATIVSRLTGELSLQPRGAAPRFAAVFATVNDAQLAALVQDRNVELVEPDVLVTLSEVRGSLESIGAAWRRQAETTPWGVTKVEAPQAWSGGNTGAGARIGIIDSGISSTHPDLSIGGGYDFTTGSASASAWDDNISVCNGHGTHVAGIAAAKQNGQHVVGVAPGATVFALKVFEVVSGGCSSWSSNQIAAINWAVTNDLDVVNFSLASSTGLTSYQNAIDAAVASGLVIVAATGNNGASTITFPARYNNVIAVAATDASNKRAWFSNAGPEVWLAAPGVSIVSTMPGATTGSKSGTSMAAPHVAGVVALLRSANPSWSVDRIRDELRLRALDIDAAGYDNQTGHGLVRAPQASGTPAPSVVIAVSPGSQRVTVQAGTTAPSASASVTMTGGSIGWSASKKKSWTTLTTATGTGSGTVAWARNTAGLAAGTYVDTISVVASGATGSPAVVYDSLVITAAPTPLALSVSPLARSASAVSGTAAPADSATVTMSGTNASTTGWTASKRKTWTTLTTASGTGSGKVRWSRSTSGLAAGTYVDTISVTVAGASGSPAVIYDTLRITAAAVPLALSVSPAARVVSVNVGATAPADSGTITLSGTNAGTTAWTATKRKSWTTLTTASGTGNGKVRWTRGTASLAAGTYVYTISITVAGATGSPARIIDTVRVNTVPTGVSLSKKGKRSTVQKGNTAPADSVTVSLSGTASNTLTWNATKRSNWVNLTTTSGTGSGVLRWTRNASSLTAGTYVDTITVTVGGATPAALYDTLVITDAPVPLTLRVTPSSGGVTVEEGMFAPAGAADVTVEGAGSTTAQWSASRRHPWTELAVASGTGPGIITWQRNTVGLAPGTYVDTIAVTLTGAVGSPARIIDTLTIVRGSASLAVTLSPPSRTITLVHGSAIGEDSLSVTVSGIGASAAAWSATSRRSWNQLTSASGTGSGVVRWTRSTTSLPIGVHVDTISVSVDGLATVHAVDSLRVVAPNIAVQVTPAGRHRRFTRGFGQASSLVAPDSATVAVVGADAPADPVWMASSSASWISLDAQSGAAPGVMTWTRNLSALANGMHVDSIVIYVASNPSVRTVVRDTIELVEVSTPTPERAAEELFATGRLDGAQRDALDQSGNRNGRYDLGDFLAWVDRAGIRLSATLMERLLSVPSESRESDTERARRQVTTP